jgi:hypothetical protein
MSAAVVARGPATHCFVSVPNMMLPPGIDQTLPHLVHSSAEASSTAIYNCHTLSVSGNNGL